jgi:hypothetical protein
MTSFQPPAILSQQFGMEFDEEAHRYRFQGRIFPSVTTMLSKLNLSPDFPDHTDFYTRRGSAVHRMIELSICGKLDLEATSPQVKTFFGGWQNFMAAHKPQIWLSEQRLVHVPHFYAGTLDIFGIWFDGSPFILDIKTSDTANTPQASTDLQTAGYELALKWMIDNGLIKLSPQYFNTKTKFKRFGLLLWPQSHQTKEKFKLVQYSNESSYNAWRGVCAAYHWKAGNI